MRVLAERVRAATLFTGSSNGSRLLSVSLSLGVGVREISESDEEKTTLGASFFFFALAFTDFTETASRAGAFLFLEALVVVPAAGIEVVVLEDNLRLDA
jgi:hypothetical protein